MPAPIEVCILAGGLSSRMGRDKARLRLGGRSLLAHVRAAARATGLPVRLVRRDLVPRCGPLGGVFTALTQSKAEVVVFLSCDQPFVTTADIMRVARLAAGRSGAVFFADATGTMGFPFAVPVAKLALVAAQIERRQYSLQKLARVLKARRLRFPRGGEWRGFNVNTPADLRQARQWRRTHPANAGALETESTRYGGARLRRAANPTGLIPHKPRDTARRSLAPP